MRHRITDEAMKQGIVNRCMDRIFRNPNLPKIGTREWDEYLDSLVATDILLALSVYERIDNQHGRDVVNRFYRDLEHRKANPWPPKPPPEPPPHSTWRSGKDADFDED